MEGSTDGSINGLDISDDGNFFVSGGNSRKVKVGVALQQYFVIGLLLSMNRYIRTDGIIYQHVNDRSKVIKFDNKEFCLNGTVQTDL